MIVFKRSCIYSNDNKLNPRKVKDDLSNSTEDQFALTKIHNRNFKNMKVVAFISHRHLFVQRTRSVTLSGRIAPLRARVYAGLGSSDMTRKRHLPTRALNTPTTNECILRLHTKAAFTYTQCMYVQGIHKGRSVHKYFDQGSKH